MRKLKPQYEDFCQSYSDGANAFGAAVAAGYSRKSAYTTGCRLLNRPEIVARIQELRRILAERESLHAPALLAKLETAYAQAVQAKNTLAIVRVIELQAKIAGLVGPRRDGRAANDDGDDEIERDLAALDVDTPPVAASARARKPSRQPRQAAPSPNPGPEPVTPTPIVSVPVATTEPVMPIVGHDEPPPVSDLDADDFASPDEELRRQEVRRLALEAVGRSRTRKRLRLSA